MERERTPDNHFVFINRVDLSLSSCLCVSVPSGTDKTVCVCVCVCLCRGVPLAPRHHHSNLSWKNCTGFPFQNTLSIKSRVCVSVPYIVLVLVTTLNCNMSTLRLAHYALLLTPTCSKIQQYKRKTHDFRTCSCFGLYIGNSLPQDLRHCSTLSSFKARLKTFLFSQYFRSN